VAAYCGLAATQGEWFRRVVVVWQHTAGRRRLKASGSGESSWCCSILRVGGDSRRVVQASRRDVAAYCGSAATQGEWFRRVVVVLQHTAGRRRLKAGTEPEPEPEHSIALASLKWTNCEQMTHFVSNLQTVQQSHTKKY
jgi:hypothetical protein